MKKYYIAGVIIGVLLLAVLIPTGLYLGDRYYKTHDREYLLQQEWDRIHDSGIMWEVGEIAHVAKAYGGYILYLDPKGTGNADYLIEYWICEDTLLDGITYEQVFDKLVRGTPVKVSYFDSRSEILASGHELYAAYAVTFQQSADATTQLQLLDFEYQRVKAGGDFDSGSVTTFRSLAELEDYCEENEETLTSAFTDAVGAYDEDFFSNHTLVMLGVKDGTSSTLHEISQVVKQPDGNYVLHLDWINPEVGDTAIGAWNILVEVDDRIAEDAQVTLEINQLYVFGGIYEGVDHHTLVTDLAFDAQRIETGGRQSYGATVIRSAAELDAYYALDQSALKDSEFLNVTAGYDDAFFEDHFLLVLPIGSSTSSEQQEVKQIIKRSDTCCLVYVDRIIPENASDEYGHWHILVEVEGTVAEHAAVILDLNEVQEAGE